MSHQQMKPGTNPLSLHKKWAEPEFRSLHFTPVTLTIGLPDTAYWTRDENGTVHYGLPIATELSRWSKNFRAFPPYCPGIPGLFARTRENAEQFRRRLK